MQQITNAYRWEKEDLKKFMLTQGIKVNKRYLDELFFMLDINEDGVIEFDEIVTTISSFNSDMEVKDIFMKLTNNLRQNQLTEPIQRILGKDQSISKWELVDHKPHEFLSHRILSKSECAIVHAGIAGGQPISGCDKTPLKMRWETRLVDEALGLGWKVEDYSIDFDLVWEETNPK